ncbi:DUF4003 family protein [Bacillus kwashiorkori]|uniref:DUF4003 family protein n=1 Tax=Bacillus kwashiorkori TaxID=1522318 RepID=UPI000B30CE24|nr:DUF4003 family protein [Bacillus kwashiorkori]
MDERVDQFLSVYSELKKALRWKVSDNKTLMLIASMFVVNKREFDIQRFLQVSEYIKGNVDAFNTLRSQERFSIGAMLHIHFNRVEDVFHSYLHLYETLINSGFKRGMFTYIAAGVLFTSKTDSQDYRLIAEKAYRIYKAMQKEHLFLTSENDYPLALLLATRNEEVPSLIERMEDFYHQLQTLGFKKGNDLQFLSHVLSLDPSADKKILSERCITLFDKIHQLHKKPKSVHYPTIGMLALCDQSQLDLQKLINVTERLNTEKDFKWQKDINFMLAAQLFISELTEDTTVPTAGLMTTLEIIMQAQQVAMIASMAAVTAATASNNN